MTRDEHNKKLLQAIINGARSEAGRKRAKKKMSQIPEITETEIQKQCISWFSTQYRKIWEQGLLIHIANERHCSIRRGRELKEMGVRKGIPDLQLFVAKKGYHGLLIEMKQPGRYPRPEQRDLMDHLSGEGYLCAVCKSLDEFRTIINNYLI